MKKILALALVLVFCALPLFSCGETPPTAAELYNGAVKAIDEATGMEAKMELTLTGTEGDQTETTSVSYDLKINGQNNSVVGKMTVFDETVDVSQIYVDGYMYVSAAGQKMKGPLSADKLDAFADRLNTGFSFTNMKSENIPAFTDDELKALTLTTESDGSYSFSSTLTKEKLEKLSSIYSFIANMDASEYSLKDVTAKFSFSKAKQLTAIEVSLSVATADGENVGSLSYKMSYIGIGTAPEITAPADASSYTDFDFDAMLGQLS